MNLIDEKNNYAGKQLTGTPQNTFNTGLGFNSQVGFYGSINYQFIDEMLLRNENSIFSEAYSLVKSMFKFL